MTDLTNPGSPVRQGGEEVTFRTAMVGHIHPVRRAGGGNRTRILPLTRRTLEPIELRRPAPPP